jgi:hypothetical protein
MQYAKLVDVDSALVDNLWAKLESSGSFYSIADGCSKEHFSKVLFESSLVVRIEGGIVRLVDEGSYVELHPIVFGHSLFRNAATTLDELHSLTRRAFQSKPIRCIIPNRMHAAMHLAKLAGMTEIDMVMRNLSGIPIACTVYEWRPEDGSA